MGGSSSRPPSTSATRPTGGPSGTRGGICRLCADPTTGRLLGAHILGHEAALLITPLVQALAHGQRVADLARGQYWIHPSLAEVVENALLKLPIDQTVRSGQAH